MTTQETAAPITIDAEHFSVRFLIPVLMIGATVITHFVGRAILNGLLEDGVDSSCVILPIDIVVLFGVGFLSERLLKRWMPSRRSATLSNEALIVTDRRKTPPIVHQIEWDKTVNVVAWRFMVMRRTRVPKGWYCMALQLLQDDTAIILYTFISPAEAEALPGFQNFVRLRPRKETVSNTDLHAVAEQRRLLKLEDMRWEDGGEVSISDFRLLIDALDHHVPAW